MTVDTCKGAYSVDLTDPFNSKFKKTDATPPSPAPNKELFIRRDISQLDEYDKECIRFAT